MKEEGGMSRRKFLGVLGAGVAMTAAAGEVPKAHAQETPPEGGFDSFESGEYQDVAAEGSEHEETRQFVDGLNAYVQKFESGHHLTEDEQKHITLMTEAYLVVFAQKHQVPRNPAFDQEALAQALEDAFIRYDKYAGVTQLLRTMRREASEAAINMALGNVPELPPRTEQDI